MNLNWRQIMGMRKAAERRRQERQAIKRSRRTKTCPRCGVDFEYVPPLPGMEPPYCFTCNVKYRAGLEQF